MKNNSSYEDVEQRVKRLERAVEDFNKLVKGLLIERKFFQSMVNSLPGIFYLFDEKGKMHRWNKNMEKITEYSAEEISTRSPFDYFDKDKKLAIDRIQEVFVKGTSDAELCIVSKTGNKIPHYFTGQKINICDISYLVGMGIDISERKRLEKALRKSEERFKELVELLPKNIYESEKTREILGKE